MTILHTTPPLAPPASTPIAGEPFANAIWNALHSTHQHLALATGHACKYPADVAPFAAVAENSPAALHDLHSLLEPQEATYFLSELPPPRIDGLRYEGTIACLQMAFPQHADLPIANQNDTPEIVPLTCADAPAMVALTDIAFPGYFRARTCVMGSYYGIWKNPLSGKRARRLIAMAGERFVLAPHREISGVCTHPDHRGHGYAATLIAQLLRDHRSTNSISCLHVASTNQHAINIYQRLGFQTLREIQFHRLVRVD